MVDLKLTVQNDEIGPLLERVQAARSKAVDEMLGPNANEQGARSATIYHVALTSIMRQLRDHQSKLAVLKEEATTRK